jgi:hypothetical protein
MRRRRQVLQVQTFPFLAVLLCTMGSLILLLLVIDRRARVVARARAEKAARLAEDAEAKRAVEAAARAVAEHKAEWERKRRELHALLAQQEEDLSGKIRAVEAQAAEAASRLKVGQDRYAELRQRLQAEEAGLRRDRRNLEARRTESRQAAEKRARQLAEMKESARKEAARLADELDQMEQVLAGLKALKRQEEHTYSVVPFFGRRGENRRPLYVECARDSVVFHPDHLTLTGTALSPLAVRKELDRRLAEPPAAGAKASPYLLLLVRPDGISSYYLLQASLAGLKIDFGYELIDQEWVLDFSNEKQMAGLAPWKNAARRADSPADAPPASGGREPPGTAGLPRLAAPGGSRPLLAGLPPGNPDGRPGAGGGPPTPPGGVATLAPGGGRSSPSGGDGAVLFHAIPGAAGGGSGPGLGYGGGSGGQQTAGAGAGPFAAPQGALPGGGAMGPGGGNVGSGSPGSGGSPAVPGHAPQGALAALGAGGAVRVGTGGPSWTGPASLAGGAATGSVALLPPGVGGLAGQASPQSAPGFSSGGANPPGPGAAAGAAGQPGQQAAAGSSSGPASLLPPPVPGLPGQSGRPPSAGPPQGQPGQQAAGGRPGQAAGAAVPGAGGAEESAERDPQAVPDRPAYGALMAPLPGRRRTPVPLGRLIGNRDWIIPIECRADEVEVLSTGQRFPTATLRQAPGPPHPLLADVRGLIDRRQATVRAGEAPYRPVLRFRVHADGLRSYYAANSLLSTLRLPTTRENLETTAPALPDPFRP